jgi:5-deoxy-glucuronate isomerase
MEKKVFGYPKYDEKGEMILTTYTNEYSDMLMDIRVYSLKENEQRNFCSKDEEIAVLLLNGDIEIDVDGVSENVKRRSVFLDGPYCGHVSKGKTIVVKANKDTEILVQKTLNDKDFDSKLYKPEDAFFIYSNKGKYNCTAARRVNTIIDYDINPKSNMVIGEVLNDPGNWSGYLPHRHPQPECYYFLFDHPEGFGASFVGDEVFKSTHKSFSAIPGGKLHPQVCAPGYQMYTCWMIRHLDGNPWLQTTRNEDDAFLWLKDAKYNSDTNSFEK